MSLRLLLFLVSSLLVDFFHKEGLFLNMCFFLIPVVLPVALLLGFELSLWWGFLLFPSGFVIGKLCIRSSKKGPHSSRHSRIELMMTS